MSAAFFLGIAALKGVGATLYATGWLMGWPVLMFLIAETLRNLGKDTFADSATSTASSPSWARAPRCWWAINSYPQWTRVATSPPLCASSYWAAHPSWTSSRRGLRHYPGGGSRPSPDQRLDSVPRHIPERGAQGPGH
ncbi:hypothetical protein DFAR_3850052 [Desulfarculales bacterium]